MLTPLVALALLGDPEASTSTEAPRALLFEPDLGVRVSAGPEWDSNAPRLPSSEGGGAEGDGVMRILADLRARLAVTPTDGLTLRYVAGMKRFFRLDSEDLFVHDLDATALVTVVEGLEVSVDGRYRASRIRDRNRGRDYTLASASAVVGWRLLEDLRVYAEGRYDTLDFPPSCLLSYAGPSARGGADLTVLDGLEVGASGGVTWRDYEGLYDPERGYSVTLCNGGPDRRLDTEPWASVHSSYRGAFAVGAELQARFSTSTDPNENIDRFRATAWATVPLPLSLVLNAQGALQFNRGISASQALRAVEDDENQNSFEVELSHRLTDGIDVSARYAVYANEFATATASFVRHVVSLGVSFEAGTE